MDYLQVFSKLSNTDLNNAWITGEIKRESRKHFKQNEIKT